MNVFLHIITIIYISVVVYGGRLSREEQLLQDHNEHMKRMKRRLKKKQEHFETSLNAGLQKIKEDALKALEVHTDSHKHLKDRHNSHMKAIERDHAVHRIRHIQIQSDAELALAEQERLAETFVNKTRERTNQTVQHHEQLLEFKKKQEINHRMELKRIEEFIENLKKEEEDRKIKKLDPELFEIKATKMHGGPISFAYLDKNRDDVVTLDEVVEHGWPQKIFFRCDVDADGFVNRDEFRAQSLNGPFVSFIRSDSNLDGSISKEEWTFVGYSEMYFLTADSNRDNKLTKSEWIRWPYGNGYIFAADVDGDGMISKSEWEDMGWSSRIFYDADVSGDGKLNSDEFNIASMEYE